MTKEGPKLRFLEHLEELRWRLFRAFVALMLGGIVSYVFRDVVFDLLTQPFTDAFGEGAPIQTLKPTEAFSSALRIAMFGGFIIGSPVIMWQLWRFVAPGLRPVERKWAAPIVVALVVLFLGGVAFAYYLAPRGLQFLQAVLPVALGTTLSEYLSFILRFLLMFGVAFEFPVFLFAAAAMGVTSSQQLADGRRWAVVIIVIVGAAATPTGDPFTMFALAIPLYLLYEGTLLLIRFVLRK
jgi:sec-independent protein translocase protein TatC